VKGFKGRVITNLATRNSILVGNFAMLLFELVVFDFRLRAVSGLKRKDNRFLENKKNEFALEIW